MRVLALECGWLASEARLVLTGEAGRMRLPVASWLIEHPRGRLLFDSGMHPELQGDPHARLGPVADVFEFSYGPGEDVASRLRALEIDPTSIRLLVNSHLHFDHVGGNTVFHATSAWLPAAANTALNSFICAPVSRASSFFPSLVKLSRLKRRSCLSALTTTNCASTNWRKGAFSACLETARISRSALTAICGLRPTKYRMR